MTSFFWSAGHIGWFFFGVLVFSVLCLLVTDIVWRMRPTSSRKLLSITTMLWAAGVLALIACWYIGFRGA